MADTAKRNSMAGKVATPRTAGTPPTPVPSTTDHMEVLRKAVGARVKITTVAPHSQTYDGTLFTACATLNIVAINTRLPPANASLEDATTQPGDYHIIPPSRIQSVQVLDRSKGSTASAAPSLGTVDMKRSKEREQARIAKLKEEESNRGKGVTKEAQAIYDSLKRINMPVRWHNQEIIVHEAVIIAPPYRVIDCKGSKDKQETLNRVRKVLEGERRKLKDKEERERAAVIPTGPRKGG